MPLHVMFPLTTTPLHLIRPARVVCTVSSMFCFLTRQPVPVTSCVELQSFCTLPMLVMLVFIAQTCEHASAYGMVCTRACKHVVHAYFYCAIYNERWTLISFGDMCVPARHCCGSYNLTIPPSYTLAYYPRTQHPPCPLSQDTGDCGGTPSLDHGRAAAKPAIGARQRRFWLSSCSLLPAPCAAKTSPGLAPTQQPCLQPLFTPASLCTATPPHPHLPTHHFLQIHWP